MSYSLGMPVNPNRGAIGRAATIAATAVAAFVLLAGCVPPTPTAVPTTSPAAEPVFASDAEALAAAEEAYVAYLAMSDLIAQEGGRDPERIAPFVTEEQLARELTVFDTILASGMSQGGVVRASSPEVQSLNEDRSEVVAYFCLDYSGVSIRNPSNTAVEAARGSDFLVVVATFEAESSSILKVGSSEPWEEVSMC